MFRALQYLSYLLLKTGVSECKKESSDVKQVIAQRNTSLQDLEDYVDKNFQDILKRPWNAKPEKGN